ncbi:efflux RND transporter periplasmic adaptor subunit [Steroidobacter sp. S1-65]|uniref:Efflux RND transporter periplasmic adaptor subunit n=1 Tax=Steroidobacter gossypii TaxID=2805490 RepID=A0ABS1WUJ6_9GAMM|nr:efflux RND transporter periplasmic adaptor subunit [Steroidobacter gossypii]MBM0104649.1 efflux RND transporter periplasmic adaptor subunit [Steroidobacter gossypii]
MKQTRAPAGVFSGWRKMELAAVLGAAVIAGACHYIGQDDANGLQTVTVTRGDLQKSITAVGSIEPKDYVDVGTQVSGRVMKIHVEIGDRVAKGDLIAEIDPTVYESTVRKDRATLENLKAQLEQQLAESALAATQLRRNREMRAADAVSQTTVDEAEAQAKVAAATVSATRAQIRAAEATLEGDLANLGYTKIYAPLDGTVVSQTTLEGQTVNASQSAPVIVQVANMDVMTVWAQVAEADVSRISVGMPAHFTTLGMPDKQWHGKVRAVYPTPEVENDVVLYNVLIDVDNREGQLLPQMTVQVFFTLGEAKDVPLAPINALQARRDAGANAYKAKVLTDNGIVERDVKIGLTNRSTAQIVSGLLPGDRLIVTNAAPAGSAAAGGRMRQMGPRL